MTFLGHLSWKHGLIWAVGCSLHMLSKLGVNVWSCCIVALQCILCDNSPGRKQGKEGYRRILHRGGKALMGHHACVAYTYSHGSIYMFICKSVYAYVCDWARRLPGKWMCWPHQRVSSWWRGFGSGALAATRSGGSLHLCCLGTGPDCGFGGWSVCVCVCVHVYACKGVCVVKAGGDWGPPFSPLNNLLPQPVCMHAYMHT